MRTRGGGVNLQRQKYGTSVTESLSIPGLADLVDAHCHLQDGFLRHALEPALIRARAAGVRMMCCNGTHEGDWRYVLGLGRSHEDICVSVGLHPWYVAERGGDWLARLEELVAGNPVGIGEIGLDNALEARNDSEQEEVFLAQMELAANYGRPVTVHCRKAFGRMVELVEAMKMRPPFMMLHAYAGSHEMVPVFEKLGFHISICASITRTANRKARTACVRVSPDRLLVESDSPAIAPVGVDFERNEPAYLPMVVQALAELRGEEPEAVAARTAANARLFFRCCAGVGTATK
ncbi:MAG: TatD family hydrolase [Desulfomicrobium sp.]|nr:TatD family hydrolase [Desulfomicrobium sp.]